MKKFIPLIMTSFALILYGCSYRISNMSDLNVNTIHTQAVLTFAVEHPGLIESFTPTLSPTPSYTPTLSPTVSIQPSPSITMTPTIACVYDSKITDETIPDGTKFYLGQSFDKMWEFYNTGTCKWTTDVTLVFINGKRMNGVTINLDELIKPHEFIQLFEKLKAPSSEGEYTGYWQLLDPKGNLFGAQGRVDIIVSVKPTATITNTPTRTNTPVATRTFTRSVTPSPTPTRTPTLSPTATQTSTATATSTSTQTLTPTFTSSPTATETPTPSDTPSPSPSPT